LDALIYSGAGQDLATRFREAIPEPLGPTGFCIQLGYEGELIELSEPISTLLPPVDPTSEAPYRPLTTCKVARLTEFKAEASAKTQRELPPDRLFTSSPLSVGDHIIKILYSECALIFRRRLLEKDPASPNLASRRSDGRQEGNWQFGSMIDRGYKSNVWVTAEDMLVIIASINKSSSGR
jgi:hypothetical protein